MAFLKDIASLTVEVLFIFGKVLSAHIFDLLQLLIILLVNAIVVGMHFVGRLLDEIPQILNLLFLINGRFIPEG